MQKTTIDLLRHGEVQGGACYRGRQDDALTDQGLQQMWASVGEQRPWQSIVSSPLQRCHSFASQLHEEGVSLHIDPAFAEIDFGDWEGKTAEEIALQDEKLLHMYWQNPTTITPPQGESFQLFQQRVSMGWKSLLDTFSGQHVLLVSHAGVMRNILSQILKMPEDNLFSLDVPHACLSRVVVYHHEDGDVMQLKFHAGCL